MGDNDASPSASSIDASLARVKALIAGARSQLDEGDPVAALNTLLTALQALGTPDNALNALTTTVSALLGPGGGGSGEGGSSGSGAAVQPPLPSADALAGLLAQCSLEASRRLAQACEAGGGGVATPMEEAGVSATAAQPVLTAGDGSDTAVCPACLGQVAVARMAAHVERWCPGGHGA